MDVFRVILVVVVVIALIVFAVCLLAHAMPADGKHHPQKTIPPKGKHHRNPEE